MSKRKQRRARNLIGWIEPLRLSFPEFEPILADLIDKLKDEATRNPESDRALVLSAIHAGAWTISDILDELPTLKRKALQGHLDKLLEAKIVIASQRNAHNALGGRPEILYLPAPNSLGK